MRPGPNITTQTAVPPANALTNTATWFAVGLSKAGPTTPRRCTSFAQWTKLFGERGTWSSTIYDAVETYFAEGGSEVVFSRIVGGSAVAAKVEAEDTAKTAKALVISADGAGTWANKMKVVVGGAEGAFTLTVQNEAGETLEISPALANEKEAIAWSRESQYITITAGGGYSEAKSLYLGKTYELTGGTDETSVTTAMVETAAKKFGPEWGPGQLQAPGITTTAVSEAIGKIAGEQYRRAITDQAIGASKSEMVTAAGSLRTAAAGKEGITVNYGDPQYVAPLAGLATPRTVVLGVFVAAKIAAIDKRGNPNQAVAGKWGALPNSLGKANSFTPTEVEELYLAGVNTSKVVGGQVRIYGCRSVSSPEKEPLYVQWNNSRLDMAVIWKGLAIEEELEFSQLDAQGEDTGNYGNRLKGMLLELYNLGALYGRTPAEAFAVDTGEDINTATTENEGDLLATIAMKRSKAAEQTTLNIVRVGLTQEV